MTQAALTIGPIELDCCKVPPPIPKGYISFFYLLPEETLCLGGSGHDGQWTQMVEQRLHTFNWISLAAGRGFLRALAERISLQQALRHRFARCWYQPRVGTATPATSAALQLLVQLPCPAMPPPTMCVPPPSCEIGAFRAAAENLGPWCVGSTGRDGPAGYSKQEVSAARVSPSAAASCYSSHSASLPPQFNRSSEARDIQLITQNHGAKQLGQV